MSEWTIVKRKKKKRKSQKKIVKNIRDCPSIASVSHQNWSKPTILRKKFQKIDKKVAIRQGLTTSVKKKNPNRQHLYKIGEETENFIHKKISHNFKIELMKARISKNMTQEQLAKLVSIKKNILVNYENGSILPDPIIISKLQQILGVKLPRS